MVSDDEMKWIDDYNENMAKLFKSLNLIPLENNLKQATSLITESMPDISSEIDKALQPLKDTLDKISPELIIQNLEKSSDIMFNNGWWLIPTMPFPFYTQLVKVEDLNKKDMTEYLVKYHNKNDCGELDNLVKRWELDEFKDLKEIFEDALWAHKKSKFTLSIPALTIQVEATLRMYFNDKLGWNIKSYKKNLKNQYEQTMKNKNGNLSYGDIFDNFTKIQNIKFLDERIEKSFAGRIDPAPPRDFDELHRNPLLHGQYKNYTIEMSTKLFLFLDMIHYILNDLEKSKKR